MLDYIASLHPNVTGALGFLLGLLAGHRIKLVQDRRKEFNEYALPVREKLIEARGWHDTPYYAPSEVELDRLFPYYWPAGRRRLRAAVEAHRASYKSNFYASQDGRWGLRDVEEVRHSIDPILRAIRLR